MELICVCKGGYFGAPDVLLNQGESTELYPELSDEIKRQMIEDYPDRFIIEGKDKVKIEVIEDKLEMETPEDCMIMTTKSVGRPRKAK